MAPQLKNGLPLIGLGGLPAVDPACCCGPGDCCSSIPTTTYALLENLGGCDSFDALVELNPVAGDGYAVAGWQGDFTECGHPLRMRFICRPPQTGLPLLHQFTLRWIGDFDPFGPLSCSNSSGSLIPLHGFPAASIGENECLPVVWVFNQCEESGNDPCCEEGGSVRITWMATPPALMMLAAAGRSIASPPPSPLGAAGGLSPQEIEQLGLASDDPTLLGNRIAALTTALGIPPCDGCGKRKAWLNTAHRWLRERLGK